MSCWRESSQYCFSVLENLAESMSGRFNVNARHYKAFLHVFQWIYLILLNTIIFFTGRSSHDWVVKWRICTHQTWVKLSMVLLWVTGGGRKGIQPRLLPCTRKSPTLVKVHKLDIAPLRETPPQKRSGIALVLEGPHSFYLHTNMFICNQNRPYLPLPSQI